MPIALCHQCCLLHQKVGQMRPEAGSREGMEGPKLKNLRGNENPEDINIRIPTQVGCRDP